VQFTFTSGAIICLGGMSDTVPKFFRLSWEPSGDNVSPRWHIEPPRWPISNELSYFELVLVHFTVARGKRSRPPSVGWVEGLPGPKLLRMGTQEQLDFHIGARPAPIYLWIELCTTSLLTTLSGDSANAS
jgi:hypothetical protein